MSPFGGQPGIVEIEVAHQHADVEGSLGRVQSVRRTGDPGTFLELKAGDNRPQQLDALRMIQRQQSAGQGVLQTQMGGRPGFVRIDPVATDIVGDLLEQRIGIGATARRRSGCGHEMTMTGQRAWRMT